MDIAEQATGCIGAGSYKDFAEDRGYVYIEVLNWCSSAGDWQFIVSRDGRVWRVLEQENNYPSPGFTHRLGDEYFYGTSEEVLNTISERW